MEKRGYQPHESSTETEPKKSSKMPANGCASALHHTAGAHGAAGEELFNLPACVWATCKTKSRESSPEVFKNYASDTPVLVLTKWERWHIFIFPFPFSFLQVFSSQNPKLPI